MQHNNINDGVPGVTECPIPPGSSKTYSFVASQYGTSWWVIPQARLTKTL